MRVPVKVKSTCPQTPHVRTLQKRVASGLMVIADDTIVVSLDRDSVAVGDDTDSHAARAHVPVSNNVMERVGAALRACPLASISGGKATWLIDAGDTCVGVIAQQGSRPQFIVAEHTGTTDVFAGKSKTIYFRYGCQADPEALFEALHSGQLLPPRY